MFKKLHRFFMHSEWKISLWNAIFGAGGLVTTFGAGAWAAKATEWLNDWGPIAWLASGFASALLFLLAIYIIVLIREIFTRGSLNKAYASPPRTVNPLGDVFERQRINLSDFSRPFAGPPWNNKTFRECEIFGPGNLLLTNNNVVTLRGYVDCDAVIVPPTLQAINSIPFANCQFIRCIFYKVTFILTKDDVSIFPNIVVLNRVPNDGNPPRQDKPKETPP